MPKMVSSLFLHTAAVVCF